jgi:hypothetical protein
MGNISERRKLTTATEFRAKARSLRTVAAELQDGATKRTMLAMADAWEAKVPLADAEKAPCEAVPPPAR